MFRIDIGRQSGKSKYQALLKGERAMPAQLRPVARQAREAGTVVRVNGLEVGILMNHPYVVHNLELFTLEMPHSSLSVALERAGRLSRNPLTGHGYIRLYLDHIEVPLTDWAAKDRGEDPRPQTTKIDLPKDAREYLGRVAYDAHKREIGVHFARLVAAIRAAWYIETNTISVGNEAGAAAHIASGTYDPRIYRWVVDLLERTPASSQGCAQL